MRTAIIIQARVGSTRFPNKMTIPFYNGRGMLYYLLSRMVKANLSAPLILAIPDSIENDAIADIGNELGINVFRGSEDDVLQRFIGAATKHDANAIIRVCADNPFLDIPSITTLMDALEVDSSDYISFCLSNGTPTIRTHYGFWPEAVRLSALQTAANKTGEKLYHEHVTNFIYTHSNIAVPDFEKVSAHDTEIFTRKCIPINSEIESNSWARFTVDTAQDFQNMMDLAANLTPLNLLKTAELIDQVAKNPTMKATMLAEINKNQK